jgi:hypothetical protein
MFGFCHNGLFSFVTSASPPASMPPSRSAKIQPQSRTERTFGIGAKRQPDTGSKKPLALPFRGRQTGFEKHFNFGRFQPPHGEGIGAPFAASIPTVYHKFQKFYSLKNMFFGSIAAFWRT